MNPILAEIHGLSDAAKGALGMAGHTLPTPEATAAAGAPSIIPPGMLLPHPENASLPGNISMPGVTPMLPSSAPPSLVTGPKRGQAMMSNGEPTPIGTTMGDQAERSRLLSEGSGISQIGSKIENSRLGEAHPFAGKLLGGLAQGAATLGDIGLSAVAPQIAANVPGTELHHQELVNRADKAVAQDTTNAQREAQAASENATAGKTNAETPEVAPEAAARIGLENAQASEVPADIELKKAQVYGAENPWAKLPENQPLQNVDQLNKSLTDREQVMHPGAQLSPEYTLPPNATKGDFDRIDKMLTAQETAEANKANHADSERLREATLSLAQQNASDKNLWSVPQSDGSFKVEQLKPGDTIPKGAVSLSGQSTQNAKAGGADVKASLDYANDYLASKAWTGPGDEALQDQFFNLAKPTTGFRMNQAQIDQLHNMASWMDSWRGKAYHAINGTWFAPEQRRQIVETMNNLASSKGVESPSALPKEGAESQHKVGDSVKIGDKTVTIKKIYSDGTFDY